jgi:hypothetical protein
MENDMQDLEEIRKMIERICNHPANDWTEDDMLFELVDRCESAEKELSVHHLKLGREKEKSYVDGLNYGLERSKQIEAELKELREQKPVAYFRKGSIGITPFYIYRESNHSAEDGFVWHPLYSAPVAQSRDSAEPDAWMAKADLALLSGGGNIITGGKTSDDDLPVYVGRQQSPAVAVPNKIKPATRTLESFGYANGWNDCRDAMLSAALQVSAERSPKAQSESLLSAVKSLLNEQKLVSNIAFNLGQGHKDWARNIWPSIKALDESARSVVQAIKSAQDEGKV